MKINRQPEDPRASIRTKNINVDARTTSCQGKAPGPQHFRASENSDQTMSAGSGAAESLKDHLLCNLKLCGCKARRGTDCTKR